MPSETDNAVLSTRSLLAQQTTYIHLSASALSTPLDPLFRWQTKSAGDVARLGHARRGLDELYSGYVYFSATGTMSKICIAHNRPLLVYGDFGEIFFL